MTFETGFDVPASHGVQMLHQARFCIKQRVVIFIKALKRIAAEKIRIPSTDADCIPVPDFNISYQCSPTIFN